MKRTRVIPPEFRPAEEWIVVDVGEVVVIDATLGQNFRFVLDRNATIRIDRGTSGATVKIRVEQDVVGGWTLTAIPSLVFRNGETTLPLAASAGAVTEIVAQYDELARAFEIVSALDRTRATVLFATSASVAAAIVTAETYTDVVAATLQPLDADLTSIAAIATTSYGRALLALADAPAGRTALALDTAATHPATDFETAGTAATLLAALGNQQTFSGAVLSASIVGGQYVLGDSTNGIPSRNGKTLTLIVVQAQVALAILTSVTVKVVNFTKATSASVTIVAGETYHRATISLAKDAADEIGLQVDSVTGAPAAGIFNIYAL